jgi:hypothetical protein
MKTSKKTKEQHIKTTVKKIDETKESSSFNNNIKLMITFLIIGILIGLVILWVSKLLIEYSTR